MQGTGGSEDVGEKRRVADQGNEVTVRVTGLGVEGEVIGKVLVDFGMIRQGSHRWINRQTYNAQCRTVTADSGP